MSEFSKISTDKIGYIEAVMSQVRLASERVISAPTQPSKEPLRHEVRAETASGFAIGVDSLEKPTTITITIDYKVFLKLLSTEKQIVEYEAKHEAQFTIVRWAGFDDWLNMPSGSITPYMSMMHNIALRKAEATLLEMGLKGLTLPRQEKFDGDESLANAETTKSAETAKV